MILAGGEHGWKIRDGKETIVRLGSIRNRWQGTEAGRHGDFSKQEVQSGFYLVGKFTRGQADSTVRDGDAS
jgi:hypothetical protein